MIDDFTAEYSGDDFLPVSFVSPQNTNIGLVQFVLKCDGIEKPEETVAAPVDEPTETIWDRFTALFTEEK
jgi:putative membrane protein